MYHSSNRARFLKLILATCLCTSGVQLIGQTTADKPAVQAAQPSTAASEAASTEPTKLSPYEVSVTGDRGYGTSSGLGGTRTNEPLIESSMTINTLNKAFLDDLGFTQLDMAIQFVSGMSSSGGQDDGRYTSRGRVSSGSNFRDGLPEPFGLNSTELIDSSLYDRIEVVKGPAGVLFGSMDIGGTVNRISKRPVPVDKTTVSTAIDDYGVTRSELDTNLVLKTYKSGASWSFRLAGAYQNGFRPDKTPDNRTAINPSIEYRSASGDQFWIYTAFQNDLTATKDTSPGDKTHPNGVSYPFPGMSGSYPLFEGDSPRWDTHRLIETGYIKNFSLFGAKSAVRFVARFNNNSQDRANASNLGYNVYGPTGVLLGTNTQVYWNSVTVGAVDWVTNALSKSEEWWWDRGESLSADFSTQVNLFGGTHKIFSYIQETHDHIEDYFITENTRIPGIFQRWPYLVLPPNFANYLWLPAANARLGTNMITHNMTTSFAAQDNIYYFNGRLIVSAGARHDDQVSSAQNILTGVYPTNSSVDWSNKLGLIVQPLPWQGMSIYFNHSTTFTPVSTIDTNSNSPTFGQKFPDQVGSNNEGGLKLDLFHARIVGTIVYFQSVLNNQLLPTIAPDGLIINQPVGTVNSRGVESDISVQATPDLNFITSFSTLRSITSTGVALRGAPQHTFAFFGKYSLPFPFLKGFAVTGGYRFAGDRTGDAAGDFKTPNLNLVNGSLNYSLKHWRFQVLCDNLLNKIEVTGSVDQNRLDLYNPRTFTFKTTFTF